MTEKADTVIIGGGAMGLAVGYNLIRKGMENTVVLEGRYLNVGSTGRNIGVIKERIPTALSGGREDLIKIAREGLKIHARLSSETGINTYYRRSGCLTIARTEEDMKQLEGYHPHFRRLGLRDDYLTPEEIQSRWPYIDARSSLGGFYSPDEAMVHPFGVVWAYVESIKRMGGRVETHNKVKKISRTASGYRVEAKKNVYESENVVITASASSPWLAGQLGFHVPLEPMRKEELISEPIRPFFGPTIERLSVDYQIAQTMRGEVLGTIGYMPPGFDLTESTSGFLNDFADETLSIIPVFKDLRIIRQWTGICDMTLDLLPVVGSLEEGLYISCGHHSHLITLAPIVGQLLAENIITGSTSRMLESFIPQRFDFSHLHKDSRYAECQLKVPETILQPCARETDAKPRLRSKKY